MYIYVYVDDTQLHICQGKPICYSHFRILHVAQAVNRVLKECDSDGDGQIDFGEFMKTAAPAEHNTTQEGINSYSAQEGAPQGNRQGNIISL